MGTWDSGILDNDSALDGLGDLTHGIVEEVVAFGAAKPGAKSTGKLAAAVGVLLQLDAFDFTADSDSAARIVDALKAHESGFSRLSPAAEAVLRAIIAGKGSELADRPAELDPALAASLHASGRSGFGLREPSLFEGPEAVAFVGRVAKRCAAMVDDDFEDEDNWRDLCREATGMGALAALLVLDPCTVSPKKVEGWRKKAAAGLAQLEAEPDDELDFQREYYRSLDGVFAGLLVRSGASPG